MTAFTVCESSGKRGYASPKAMHQAHRRSGDRLRAYRCPDCHRWHPTSNIGRPLRKVA